MSHEAQAAAMMAMVLEASANVVVEHLKEKAAEMVAEDESPIVRLPDPQVV